MNCPLCQGEMEEGGLIINCVDPGWVPMEQFRKRGLRRMLYTGLRSIGKTNLLLGQTRVPNAFFCRRCNKIVGVFDVTNQID